MVLRIFKAFWFLSMLATLGVLLLHYASLPETVVIQDDGISQISIGKEAFFYLCMTLLVLINVLVFIMNKVYPKQIDFRTWFYGLVISFNIFFIISISLINVYNSSEKFSYHNIAFVIYGSLGLLILWTIAWPVYIIYLKFFPKQSISEL